MRIGQWSFGRLAANPVFWAVVAFAGFAAWISLPELSDAEDQSTPVPSAVISPTQGSAWADPTPTSTVANPAAASPAGAVGPAAIATAPEAVPPEAKTETRTEKAPIEGLRISAQSWHRGGLGSKALVTLTLRNANDYPVRDIEIACAFARRDGRHLTDRKRVISDTIGIKSRKTYARMLVGFVNINANKAKCSLVTASRI